jgi:hypothetical protein
MAATDRRANWEYWSHIIKAEVWQAVALSFGAEPIKVPGLDLDWRDGEFDECPPNFLDRLEIACNHIETGALRAEGTGQIPFRKVRLAHFFQWAFSPPRSWPRPKQFPPGSPRAHTVIGPNDLELDEVIAKAPEGIADPAPSPILNKEKRRGALLKWAKTEYGDDLAKIVGRDELLPLGREHVASNVNSDDVRWLRKQAPEHLRRGGRPKKAN